MSQKVQGEATQGSSWKGVIIRWLKYFIDTPSSPPGGPLNQPRTVLSPSPRSSAPAALSPCLHNHRHPRHRHHQISPTSAGCSHPKGRPERQKDLSSIIQNKFGGVSSRQLPARERWARPPSQVMRSGPRKKAKRKTSPEVIAPLMWRKRYELRAGKKIRKEKKNKEINRVRLSSRKDGQGLGISQVGQSH